MGAVGSWVFAHRTKEAAEKALKEMDGAAVGQWRLRVGWAHHKQDSEKQLNADAISKADPANNNVYVGNLAPEVCSRSLLWLQHPPMQGTVLQLDHRLQIRVLVQIW